MRKNNKKGFTLVETIVTMTISVILIAALTLSITAFNRYASFKKQNGYAETLFEAAQMQLTANSQMGALEAVQKAVDVDGHELQLSAITNSMGNSVTGADVWKDTDSRYWGKLCQVIGTKEDYARYRSGALTDSTEDQALNAMYDLFDAYLYDKSILSATVCVEFDPYDGLVYAVLYSDRAADFTYGAQTHGAVNICNRSVDYRRENLIGYYGVDTLSKATSTEAQKPVINSVMLNNEETLNVTFKLSKVQEATSQLIYELDIYKPKTDGGDDTLLMTIRFNDPSLCSDPATDFANYRLVAEDSLRRNCTIQAEVHHYGTTFADGIYTFPAWIDSNQMVHFVLDAVDSGATVEAFTAGNLKHTYSLHRFGLSADNIYCTVLGSGTGYNNTAKRTSNTENAFFAKKTDSVFDGLKYTLTNGRHLFNVRFEQQKNDSVTYSVAENLSWADMIGGGFVYKSQENLTDLDGYPWISGQSGVDSNENRYKNLFTDEMLKVSEESSETERAFPSFAALDEGSRFGCYENRTYTVSGLLIRRQRNQLDGVTAGRKTEATGLFLKNYGSVENINFDDFDVQGTDAVGLVCGINDGVLTHIALLNSNNTSEVSGESYVGGVAGCQERDKKANFYYESLTNRAQVSGNEKIGGIIGALESIHPKTTIVLEGCKNYGRVFGTAQDIGGIIGYVNTNNKENVSLLYCVSSPQYEASEIYSNGHLNEAYLQGSYVGGIIGRNNGASLTGCNTASEHDKSGFVLGERYVGGIVGYNEGQDATLDGGGAANQANVIGRKYVGGIVGANAQLTKDEPKESFREKLLLTNWTNTGIVLATEAYGGGVTGWNSGRVTDCTSAVSYSATAQVLVGLSDVAGDYIGGIVGYNCGVIGTTTAQSMSVLSVLRGNCYVGGIVGYNASGKDCSVTNYMLRGGYIFGDAFVGGFAGLNANEQLLRGGALVANPNSVSGSYCVGGILGANLVNTKQNLATEYSVYNILGNINGKQFVGGFIGFNMLVKSGTDALQLSQTMRSGLGADELKNLNFADSLAGADSGSVMSIDGSNVQLRAISADICVGGVIGYNHPQSTLCISNVTNSTPVRALKAVASAERGSGDSALYSYAGGIVGKISQNIAVIRCQNKGAGGVAAVGTYSGSISEINCGLIAECLVENIGSGDGVSCIGGITGLNLASKSNSVFGSRDFVEIFAGRDFYAGKNRLSLGIYDCELTGTVTGRDRIGGIAAVNDGLISNPKISGIVTGYGSDVGGVAGENNGSIRLKTSVAISVTGEGTNVGGVAGINSGSISVVQGSAAAAVCIAEGSNLVGSKNVGGVIGLQVNSISLNGFVNSASVRAEQGAAGGMIGYAQPTAVCTLLNCVNRGDIRATVAGNAGGMISEISAVSTVSSCWNQNHVAALNGRSGGITSVNNGTIAKCTVSPEQPEEQSGEGFWTAVQGWIGERWSKLLQMLGDSGEKLQIRGNNDVGAVASVNNGTMELCVVSDVEVSDLSTSSASSSIGGMVGVNNGTLRLGSSAVRDADVFTYTNGSRVGGIAGENGGIITAVSGSESPVVGTVGHEVTVRCVNSSVSAATFGGVVGSNSGAITGCAVIGSVIGSRGDSAVPQNGYGGVCGINLSAGSLTECSFDGTASSMGTASAISVLGGIAGRNEGVVNRCWVGIAQATNITCGTDASAYGYVGGLVGWNSGKILDSDNAAYSSARVEITGYAGHTGGIVGWNDENGQVAGRRNSEEDLSTGKNWLVVAKYYSNDCGTGGIMGYSSSGNDILYANNYAEVLNISNKNENTATGGLIGRSENKLTANQQIAFCNNYGSIWCSGQTGGLIGRIKYNGAKIENCSNYATVGQKTQTVKNFEKNGSLANSNNSGGLIGSLYQISNGQVLQIVSCENNGKVYGVSAGGLVQSTQSCTSRATLTITDCINTGVIDCSGQAGAAGILTDNTGIRLEISRCRNYGLAGSSISGKTFAGILYKGSVSLLRDCFDFSNSKTTPLVGASVNTGTSAVNNYYVYTGVDQGSTSQATDIKIGAASFAGSDMVDDSGNRFTTTYDGNVNTRCCIHTSQKSNLIYSLGNTTPFATLTYQLSSTDATDVKGFGIRWCNNGTTGSGKARQYIYKLFYRTAGSNELRQITTIDSFGNRDTYNGDAQCYVEAGFSANDESNIYFHYFNQDQTAVSNVSQIVIQIYGVKNVDSDAKAVAFQKTNPSTIWSQSALGAAVSDNPYINIFDVFGISSSQTIQPNDANIYSYMLQSVSGNNSAPDSDYASFGAELKSMQDSGNMFKLFDRLGVLTQLTNLQRNPLGNGQGTSESGANNAKTAYLQDYSAYQDFHQTDALDSLTSYHYQIIGEIEPKLKQFYQSYYSQPVTVSNVSATDVGGAYQVDWTASSQPYSFEVSYAVGDVSCGDVVLETTRNSQLVDLQDSWLGKQITFYVRAVTWQKNGSEKQYSDWQQAAAMTVKKPLPTPQVHLELTAQGYVAVLDNAADFYDEQGNFLNATITYEAQNTYTFTVEQGRSQKAFSLASQNTLLTAQAAQTSLTAKQKERYGLSIKKSVQSYTLSTGSLQGTDYCTTSFDGFYGNSRSSLYYSMRLKAANINAELYYNTELLVWDEAAGADVVVGSGESHVTGRGQEMTATLSGLGEDLIANASSVLVRSYPWRAQGYQTYYGHTVAESVTAEEMHTLTDGGTAVYQNGAYLPGYVIQKNSDKTYRVIFSSILAEADKYQAQIDSKTYTVDHTAGTVASGSESLPIQQAPVLEEQYSYSASSDSYTFRWDIAQTDSDYWVSLIGLTASGERVEISSQTVSDHQITVTEHNWKYSQLLLTVERLGKVNAAGKVESFASCSSNIYHLKERLQTITMPTVEFHMEGGVVEKNDLIYDISWQGIQHSELEQMDHYELSVLYEENDGTQRVIVANTGESFATVYFLDENGDRIATGQTVAMSESLAKGTSAVLNLNTLDGLENRNIEVSVRAIARADSVAYQNGLSGNVRSVRLPVRLELPDLSGLSWQPAQTVMSVSDFEAAAGTFTMKQSYANSGNYEMVMEITDADGNHLANLTDSRGNVINETNPVAMSGNLMVGSYTLSGVPAEYAGRYVKVRLRAVSDSEISSTWTTQPYLVRLPQVRVDTPQISTGTAVISYVIDTLPIEFTQQTVSFEPVSFANEYQIQIVQTRQNVETGEDDDYSRSTVSYLTLKKTADGYAVLYTQTDDGTDSGSARVLGTINIGEKLALPYEIVSGAGDDAIPVLSYLEMESDATFRLVLPDYDDDQGETVRPTQSVIITAMAQDADYYCNSNQAVWYRQRTGEQYFIRTKEVSDAMAAPDSSLFTVTASDDSNEAYEIQTAQKYWIVLEICDPERNKTRRYSMPGNEMYSQIVSLLKLQRSEWGDSSGHAVTIRTQFVSDSEGVSDWTEFTVPLEVLP